MVGLSLRWTDESRAWIDQLDTLPRRLFYRCMPVMRRHLRMVITAARGEMPTFEGLMAKDLRELGLTVTDRSIEGKVGWSEATVQPEYESVDKSTAPFHYPWGKHDGIAPHKVWLWSRHTGMGRAKLIRWAQANGVIPGDVPEDGSEEAIREALSDKQPPWLWVSPSSSSFLTDAMDSVSDSLLKDVSDELGVVWIGRD